MTRAVPPRRALRGRRNVAASLYCALSVVAAACAPIDDVAELDVLSHPAPPAGGAMPYDAGSDVADSARDGFTTCKMQSALCTVCISTSKCLAEWSECLADAPCLHALPVVRSCICDAQTFDAGSIVLCGQDFDAVGTAAAGLAACIVGFCTAECGL